MPDGAPASYEAAVERLEEIIDRLDSGQAGLREDDCVQPLLVEFAKTSLDVATDVFHLQIRPAVEQL